MAGDPGTGGDGDALADTEAADSAAAAGGLTLTSTGGARRSAEPSAVGRRLAHFEVKAELGRGGMGVVYRAHDVSLDRPVAIKVVADEVAGSTAGRERIFREARAQARLNHPNVGHIYFVGEDERGNVFYAMELIDGETVADRVAGDGALSAADALDVVRQAARGLREALSHGIVHRDVKPSNLMVDRHGTVKLLDFGIAKKIHAAGDSATPGAAAQTRAAGTPLYAAPEQMRGEPVDFRADIYALGATLHQMLTGEPPFRADTADALAELHLSALRPRLGRGHVGRRDPGQVNELVDRMMAKEPDQRFASYDELLEAVDFLEPTTRRAAGAFVRGMAIGIDFAIIAIAAGLITSLLSLIGGELLTEIGIVGWLTVLGGVGYMAAAQARKGATIGGRLIGIEVIAPGRAKGIGSRRAIFRNAAFAFPVLGIQALESAVSAFGDSTAVTVLNVAGVVVVVLQIAHVVWVTRRELSGRTFWDRLSGTQVRYMGAGEA